MSKLLYWLGDNSLPYRKLMAEHKDFYINDTHIPKAHCVIAEQTHSCNVHICTEQDGSAGWDDKPQIMNTDALVTNVPYQYLLSRTADCTPVLMYDEQNRAVAAVHSGRESTRKNIAAKTIQTMQSAYHTDPSHLKVWIGAGICVRHYEVSEPVWDEFNTSVSLDGINISNIPFRHIDIQSVILQQLILAGVLPTHIVQNTICTFESDRHFSFRRDSSHNRQINIIGL